jgi:hypothetical protein
LTILRYKAQVIQDWHRTSTFRLEGNQPPARKGVVRRAGKLAKHLTTWLCGSLGHPRSRVTPRVDRISAFGLAVFQFGVQDTFEPQCRLLKTGNYYLASCAGIRQILKPRKVKSLLTIILKDSRNACDTISLRHNITCCEPRLEPSIARSLGSELQDVFGRSIKLEL